MLLGKSEVIDWIAFNNTPFFNLRRTEKGPRILVKNEPDNLTIEESQEYLGRVLDMLDKGTYHIDAWGAGWQNNQWVKSSFRLGPVAGTEAAGIGDMGDIEARVMGKLKKEMEFERLKEENAELRQEIDSFNYRIGRRIEPYIPGIIEGVFGVKLQSEPPAQVAGIEDQDPEKDQERLERAFEKWFKIETEVSPVVLVEKIVELAEKDPKMYAQAKKMLL